MTERYALASRLRALRCERGYTLHAAGLRVGVHHSTIQSWETGRTSPKAWHLAAICRTYGCSADWLIGIADRREAEPCESK